MDYKDICTKREYEQNGEKKAKWFKVGTLKTTDEGKMFIDLFMMPDTSFFVFPQKPRENAGQDNTSDNEPQDNDPNLPF